MNAYFKYLLVLLSTSLIFYMNEKMSFQYIFALYSRIASIEKSIQIYLHCDFIKTKFDYCVKC